MMVMLLSCSGYYRCLRCLTESRLPSCVEQSDSVTPPSALADTILMLMTRPLTLDADSNSAFSYVTNCSINPVMQLVQQCSETRWKGWSASAAIRRGDKNGSDKEAWSISGLLGWQNYSPPQAPITHVTPLNRHCKYAILQTKVCRNTFWCCR